jgi:hypothetical protein
MPDKKLKIRGNDPKWSQPKLRPHLRCIHFSETEIWQWKTNGYEIFIFDPQRNRTIIRAWDLEGSTESEFFRNREWCEFGHAIYPSDVRTYIAKNLRSRI